jgi:deoxyribodipyrimidine photo-lyase
MMRALIWFRRDLRLQDNPALMAAVESGLPVEAVFVYPGEPGSPLDEGAAARWYLHHSLQALQRQLALIGIPLHLRRGAEAIVMPSLCADRSAVRVFWNRLVDPQQELSDLRLASRLEQAGVSSDTFDDDCLAMPEAAFKADGTAYRVFTPFWRNLRDHLRVTGLTGRLSSAPRQVALEVACSPEDVDELGLLTQNLWHRKLHAHWEPGERSALNRLTQFIEQGLEAYVDRCDRPDVDGSSRLSPALHFGELSAARVYASVDEMLVYETRESASASMRRFLAEIGWREFSRHVLHAFPHTLSQSMNPLFDNPAAWEPDPGKKSVRAWQRGETGVALVDAGMRQLWESGWMHNRVRMVVASFLTKNLGIHWREGARWFEETLVDADRASNTLGWQWVAGCGTDAAPYHRIFNPDTQARKFDPEGAYVDRWIGDRAQRPPITDLKLSRADALARYRVLRGQHTHFQPGSGR